MAVSQADDPIRMTVERFNPDAIVERKAEIYNGHIWTELLDIDNARKVTFTHPVNEWDKFVNIRVNDEIVAVAHNSFLITPDMGPIVNIEVTMGHQPTEENPLWAEFVSPAKNKIYRPGDYLTIEIQGDRRLNKGNLILMDTNGQGVATLFGYEDIIDGELLYYWEIPEEISSEETEFYLVSNIGSVGMFPSLDVQSERFIILTPTEEPSLRILTPTSGEELIEGQIYQIWYEASENISGSIGWSIGNGSLNWIEPHYKFERGIHCYDWTVGAGNLSQPREIQIRLSGHNSDYRYLIERSQFFTVIPE